MNAFLKREHQPHWKHLRTVAHKEELYLKGRKLPAYSVWNSMVNDGYTPAQAAENWGLPVEAVMEALAYCEQNQRLLKKIAEDELHFAKENGVRFVPKVAC